MRIATTDQFGRERVLAFYGPGEFFGDMAVLTGEPRSATASASTDLRLLQLRKDDFDVLVATNVGIMRGMLRVMVERQTAMNTRLTQEAGASHGRRARAGDGRLLTPRRRRPDVLATNLAVALAQLTPDRVAILDLDLLFGHVAMLLDLVPRTALAAITPAAIRALRPRQPGLLPDQACRVVAAGDVRHAATRGERARHRRPRARHRRAAAPTVRARRDRRRLALFRAVPGRPGACRSGHRAQHARAERGPGATQESQRVLRDLLGVPGERIRFVQNQPNPYGKLSRSELATSLGTDRVIGDPLRRRRSQQGGLDGFPLVMSHSANPTSRAIIGLARELEQTGRELRRSRPRPKRS